MPRPDADAYRRFDRQLRAAGRADLDGPADIRGLSSAILETIAALPQADLIPEHRRIDWMERTASAELQRHSEVTGKRLDLPDLLPIMLWHVRRLSGIGGSDAGTILLGSRGLPGSFTTARNIAAQKLLIAAPDPGNEFTQRGARAEPWLRRILMEQTGADTSADSLETLRDFRDDSTPWRIGTPDDFLLSSGPLPGFAPAARHIMIDYKSPLRRRIQEARHPRDRPRIRLAAQPLRGDRPGCRRDP